MYSLAANLSNEPINSMFPSGSMKKAIDGLAKVLGGHMGAASMTPPTRQNWSRYSSQDLYRPSEAIFAFFGRTFEMTSYIFSIMGSVISIFLFLSSRIVFMESTARVAWPLPLNSSSILNIHVFTNKLCAISLAREFRNSFLS
jgi:hypothetical protein